MSGNAAFLHAVAIEECGNIAKQPSKAIVFAENVHQDTTQLASTLETESPPFL